MDSGRRLFLRPITDKTMRSLEKRALDSLIEQVLATVDAPTRILGPGASINPLDERYVGRLKQLLMDAIPGIPEPLLTSVRDDLIVVARANVEPSDVVRFEESTLRVIKTRAAELDKWQETYGDPLNVNIKPSRYLETDLKDCSLTFSEQFFAPRSIQGWRKLSLHFARICGAMAELMTLSGLKQKEVFHESRDTHLIYTNLVNVRGGSMELTPA